MYYDSEFATKEERDERREPEDKLLKIQQPRVSLFHGRLSYHCRENTMVFSLARHDHCNAHAGLGVGGHSVPGHPQKG